MSIKSHTPNAGHNFFYVETSNDGFMCSFTSDFEDVWFIETLDSDEPTEGPEDNIVRELIAEATA